MAENSAIEWTDHTFNPWEGCQKVGPGCDHCYAEARNARFGGGVAVNWGPGAPRRRTSEANWRKPLQWNAARAEFFAKNGRRQRVFCASLADVFDNQVPTQWRADLFKLIRATPNLDWLLLTKRIGNVMDMVEEAEELNFPEEGWQSLWAQGDWPKNVWLGATIVNQEEADRDIPKLLQVPAAVRFLSMEPLLGPVDLTDLVQKQGSGEHHFSALECEVDAEDDEWNGATVDWVIVGGESGHHARPMHPDWARTLRDQCAAASVPFLFKQWGEYHPSRAHEPSEKCDRDVVAIHISGEIEGRPLEAFGRGFDPDWYCMCKLGKKAAGRLLDGVQHDGFPEVR